MRFPNTRTGRVRQFFLDNPCEELTIAEISEKFDLSVEQVRDVLHHLRDDGTVESLHVVRAARLSSKRNAKAGPVRGAVVAAGDRSTLHIVDRGCSDAQASIAYMHQVAREHGLGDEIAAAAEALRKLHVAARRRWEQGH